MAKVNENYQKLPGSYLFSEIARRTAAYSEEHPEANLIKMGIGDVTRPLAPAVIEAMHNAVNDLSKPETFHGYGPEQGYDFLREVIAENDFHARGVDIAVDEIFVSDGAKSDCGNIGDIWPSIIRLLFVILCIPYMLTLMLWLVVRANTTKKLKAGQIFITCPLRQKTISVLRFLIAR